ncbi:hypothetical protein SAY87_012823 [Trapa incisa]|uniref:MADS-box domain-containing protein n=1 Tax=Trapa incisa TaxID=236973 RepID=A0AAN7JCE2_9MYRT|nr:hypothetical protein SAY87_012823 [Trapa incisa]
MAKKPSLGRQKIAIAKIPKKNHLQVTFSKRRSGLFKKASELCTLCGVEIGILVFSPANKVFSFGHPEVDSILDRFLASKGARSDGGGSTHNSGTRQLFEAHRSASIQELNMILTQVTEQLEVDKRRGEGLDKATRSGVGGGGHPRQFWWESPVEEMNGMEELEQLRSSLEELKMHIVGQSTRLMMDASRSFMAPFLGLEYTARNDHGDQFDRKPDLDQVNNAAALVQYLSFPQENGLF